MSPSERRRRFLRELRQRLADRGAAMDAGVEVVLGTLAEMQQQLRNAIGRVDPSEFDQEHIPRILAELDRVVADWARRADHAAGAVIETLWEMGPRLTEASLAAAEVSVGRVLLPQLLLDESRDYVAEKIGGLRPVARRRVEDHVRRMVLGGQSPHQAMVGVARDLDKGPLKFVSVRCEGVIRTEGGRIYSAAGQRRLELAERQVAGLQKQWRRGKSRANHTAIHGQVRDVAETYDLPNGVSLMYPRELGAPAEEVICCACESVPYKADW